ncbi:MAG: DUF354 domain-containing protein [bacterium]
MNILIVTGHPAQIHNFRELKNSLENNGHKVFWLATNKDISKYLLNYYKIEYSLLKRPGKTFSAKAITLLQNTLIAFHFIKKNKIDITLSRISPHISIASWLLRKTHLGLTDTESAGLYDKLFSKFLTVLFTAKSFKRQLRSDQIRFDGNIELFYLHPNRFTPMPRKKVSELLGIESNTPYVIMRFVSWDAYHDKGLAGFTDENKIRAVKEFSKYARVFISSESELIPELYPYRIKIPPEKMHDVLAHTKLFFGESSTMASESAVLGNPAIYLDKTGRGYTDEEEQYGLVYNFKNDNKNQLNAISKGIELLQNPNLEESKKENHTKFMENKIDVTGFMAWFIENYPESAKIMKENQDYQYKFK